jgi:LysR family glycine cleavage system transcriptional activator
MKFDLPPLNCLPAFEAAARHKSFTMAAEELFLTQAAISFQVRNLEQALSVKLFLRQHRSLELTDEGKALFGAVRSAFKTLASEKALITNIKAKDTISISAPMSYCNKWLLPRLDSLRRCEPKVNLLIDANDSLVDTKGGVIQLAIRYCMVPPKGYHTTRLLEDDVCLVCSPQLIAAKGRDLKRQDLSGMTVLSDKMEDQNWSEWLTNVDSPQDADSLEIRFSHTSSAIDAAIAGQGVTLGRLPLVADDLDAGRLIRPFSDTRKSPYAYYILRSKYSLDNPNANAIVAWLIAEAAKTVDSFARSSIVSRACG